MKFLNNFKTSNKLKTFYIIIIIFLSLFFSYLGEKNIKEEYNDVFKLPKLNKKIIKVEILSAIFFQEIRGVFVDLLWIYIENLWHQGRFYHLPKLYELITVLQPKFTNGWVMGGWHMAYNMSHEVNSTKKLSGDLKKKLELKWITAGINFLKEGHSLNPDNSEIMFEIAWTYFHRLKDYKNAAVWFKKTSLNKNSNNISHRLYAKCLEFTGKKVQAYKKWLDLKSHSSYNDQVSEKIVNKNIKRLEKNIIIKEYINNENSNNK